MTAVPRARVAWIVAALLPFLAGCSTLGRRNLMRFTSGASIYPEVGAFGGVSTLVESDGDIEVHGEARIHYQWLDGKDLWGDTSKDWSDARQVDTSVYWRTYPLRDTHWLFRMGAVFFNGKTFPPQGLEQHQYFGIITGGGFERDMTRSWAFTVEVDALTMYNVRRRDFAIIPQFTVGLRWRPDTFRPDY